MSTSRGKCEIVEAKNELSSVPGGKMLLRGRMQDSMQRPPTLGKKQDKGLEDDINKLFDAINLRTCKSLDLSGPGRNASKRPVRASGSQSPVIGFSEPISLKQALRGQCISQAAEMAAIRRLSMASASPRISEAGKMTNPNRSVIIGAGESSCSSGARENRKELSTLKEESISYSTNDFSQSYQDSSTKPGTQRSCSSSSYSVVPNKKSLECTSSEYGPQVGELLGYDGAKSPISTLHGISSASCENKPAGHLQESMIKCGKEKYHSSPKDIAPVSEVDKPLQEIKCSLDDKHNPLEIPNAVGLAGARSQISVSPSKVVNPAANKARRKPKPQIAASTSKGSKDMKSTRSTSRAVKPVLRNRNVVIRKSRKASSSINTNSKESYPLTPKVDRSSGQLICQSCQHSLRIASEDSGKDLVQATAVRTANSGKSKYDTMSTGWENGPTHVIKTNLTPKSGEKGDISQSSKSSNCDFSSSTTSLSEDSSLLGSAYLSRPHMSKDARWVAIDGVRKHFGFLGLSHFNLLKKLGSGDIGTVYLAELVGTSSLFAIKVMDNEFLARRQKSSRAQTEREILRMLDHPFVPTLYAQFTSDNLSCLVMEFCPGGDLHVLRQKQPDRYFSEHEARFYVAEILLALEYLHMLGIVYRDLKPENILVREDGHIMLTDFDLSLRCSVNPFLLKSSSYVMEPPRVSGQCTGGSSCIDPFCTGPTCKISCLTPRFFPANARARKLKATAAAIKSQSSLPQLVAEPTEARSNSFVGTHEYLAPEIIKGEGHGSAVDWWTFGVLLYELLYGRTPFKGAGNEETLANVVLQGLKFPDTPIVSFQARDLIRRLLVKEPENRLGSERGSAEIKRHPFFEGLNWALIRCTVPPQVHEKMDTVLGNEQEDHQMKGNKFMECTANGGHLEFELF